MDISQLLFNRTVGLADPAIPQAASTKAQSQQMEQDAEQLRSVARQFETVLLHEIVKQMNQTVDYASLDEEDESGQQIQSMYWSFMTEAMGQQGGVGFWKTIYEDLARTQGIDLERFPAEGSRLNEQL